MITTKDMHEDLDLLIEAARLYSLAAIHDDEAHAQCIADACIQFEHTFGSMDKGVRLHLILLIMTRYAEWLRENDVAPGDADKQLMKVMTNVSKGNA